MQKDKAQISRNEPSSRHGTPSASDAPGHSQDAKLININALHEVRYSAQKLDVNEQKLRDTVASVGTSVEAVRKALRR
jgi:hypothetical protein